MTNTNVATETDPGTGTRAISIDESKAESADSWTSLERRMPGLRGRLERARREYDSGQGVPLPPDGGSK